MNKKCLKNQQKLKVFLKNIEKSDKFKFSSYYTFKPDSQTNFFRFFLLTIIESLIIKKFENHIENPRPQILDRSSINIM